MHSKLTLLSIITLSIFSTVGMAQKPDPGFENLALWKGLVADTTNIREGKQSGRWEDTVSTTRIYSKAGFPEDLSVYDGFKVWVHSERPTEAQIAFVFFSENEETEGDDYYVHGFPIDWAGWKQIDVSFSGIKEIRNPSGWSSISEVRIASEGFTIGNPSPETQLSFDGIEFYGAKKEASIATSMAESTNLNWSPSIADAIHVARNEDKLVFIAVGERNGGGFNEIVDLCNEESAKDVLKHFSLFAFDPNTDESNTGFFKIQKLPTLLVYKDNGEELLRITEIPEAEYFVGFLNTVRENNSGG